MYSHKCSVCGGTPIPVSLPDLSDEWKDIFNDYARMVYEHKGKGKKIHKATYFKTAERLAEGVLSGMNSSTFGYKEPSRQLQAQFMHNVYAFSAAKTMAQYSEMTRLLVDENGKLRTFNMFREQVERINPLFNEHYLKVEYNTAVANARAAQDWQHIITQDKYKCLEFRTEQDGRVRDSHRILHGIIRPIGHSFWKSYYPPLGWNCRCYTNLTDCIPSNNPEKTDDNILWEKGRAAKVSPYFKNNPAIKGELFKDSLPYFKHLPDDNISKLDAVKDYGLPDYQTMKNRSKNLNIYAIEKTEEDAMNWYQTMMTKYGINNKDFIVKDRLGTELLFTGNKNKKRETFGHIVLNEKKKYAFITYINEIISSPDEIWTKINEEGKLAIAYHKYYNDKLLKVYARNEEKGLRIITVSEGTDMQIVIRQRKGILLYKK